MQRTPLTLNSTHHPLIQKMWPLLSCKLGLILRFPMINWCVFPNALHEGMFCTCRAGKLLLEYLRNPILSCKHRLSNREHCDSPLLWTVGRRVAICHSINGVVRPQHKLRCGMGWECNYALPLPYALNYTWLNLSTWWLLLQRDGCKIKVLFMSGMGWMGM